MNEYLRPLLLALAVAFSTSLQAGPVADFNAELRDAYGSYRQALFATNKNDPALSAESLAAFAQKWALLSAKWSDVPPPQFSDDEQWQTSLAHVRVIASQARAMVAGGQLAEAHDELERIRDVIATARARNGVISFSDHMNEYHALMEHMLSKRYQGRTAQREFSGDASVLEYLLHKLERAVPQDYTANPEFSQALAAVRESVAALMTASDQSNSDLWSRAVQGLKKPYAQLFLNFG